MVTKPITIQALYLISEALKINFDEVLQSQGINISIFTAKNVGNLIFGKLPVASLPTVVIGCARMVE
jgi:hypothetical protein